VGVGHHYNYKMRKFEKIVGLIAVVGLVLKIALIPGGGFLLSITLGILSMFYFAFSFALFNGIRLRDIFKSDSYQNTNAKRTIGAVVLGISLSELLIGSLFKIQFLPGSAVMLNVGLLGTLIVLIISVISYFRNKADFYKRVFKRIAVFGVFGLVVYLVPTPTLVDIFNRNNPEYAELFKKVLANPGNVEFQEQLDSLQIEIYKKEVEEAQRGK